MKGGAVFPVFLRLEGRRVLVVGGGAVAASKIPALRAAGAEVVVVAPAVGKEVESLGVAVLRREFRPSDLVDVWFVVAAATPEVNRDVAEAALARRLFVNSVDDPDTASAFLGGVVRRAGVTLAISTNGVAPALAGLLREALEDLLPEGLGGWLSLAAAQRRRWRAERVPMTQRRPLLLRALNERYERRGAA